MPTGKRRTEEIADYMGKVTLVSNLSYLFSAGTNCINFIKAVQEYASFAC